MTSLYFCNKSEIYDDTIKKHIKLCVKCFQDYSSLGKKCIIKEDKSYFCVFEDVHVKTSPSIKQPLWLYRCRECRLIYSQAHLTVCYKPDEKVYNAPCNSKTCVKENYCSHVITEHVIDNSNSTKLCKFDKNTGICTTCLRLVTKPILEQIEINNMKVYCMEDVSTTTVHNFIKQLFGTKSTTQISPSIGSPTPASTKKTKSVARNEDSSQNKSETDQPTEKVNTDTSEITSQNTPNKNRKRRASLVIQQHQQGDILQQAVNSILPSPEKESQRKKRKTTEETSSQPSCSKKSEPKQMNENRTLTARANLPSTSQGHKSRSPPKRKIPEMTERDPCVRVHPYRTTKKTLYTEIPRQGKQSEGYQYPREKGSTFSKESEKSDKIKSQLSYEKLTEFIMSSIKKLHSQEHTSLNNTDEYIPKTVGSSASAIAPEYMPSTVVNDDSFSSSKSTVANDDSFSSSSSEEDSDFEEK